MNLADAIRRAAHGNAVAQTAPAGLDEIVEGWSAPEPIEVIHSHESEQSHSFEEDKPMNPQYESTPEQPSPGTAVRLEIFLTPDQLSTLFRAVAAQQHSMLTLREAASYLRVPATSLEQMASAGELPGFLIDGRWRFNKAAIDEWLTGQQQQRKEVA